LLRIYDTLLHSGQAPLVAASCAVESWRLLFIAGDVAERSVTELRSLWVGPHIQEVTVSKVDPGTDIVPLVTSQIA
jgi:hypothetical protein